MQLTPLTLLVSQCRDVTNRLERLHARNRRYNLLAISGLCSDLQRVYAIELVLMQLERTTKAVRAEVAEAIGGLLETISVTYGELR